MTDRRQLTREELKGMTPRAIAAALRQGCLRDVLEGREPEQTGGDVDLLASLPRSEIDRMIAERRGSADQGARPGPELGQLRLEWVENASPEEIAKALADGRLDALLGR